MTPLSTSKAVRRLSPAPPLLILACLLIWGWRTDFMLFAIVMGVLLELPYLIKWRITFSDKDINQIVDLSGLLFFIATIYLFVNYGAQGIYKVLEITPFTLFLILLTQRFSVSNAIKTSALFVSIRKLGKDAGDDLLYDVDISLPYVFICLISASAIPNLSRVFFVLIAIITVWLMWSLRPKHFPIYRWLLPMLFVISSAYLLQNGIQQLHRSTENLLMTLLDQYGWRSRNPEKFMTAIGSVGRLKLSDRVILRIKADESPTQPIYLQETTYSHYDYGIWRNDRIEYDVIPKQPNKNNWQLYDGLVDKGQMRFAMFLDEQSTILPSLTTVNSLSGKDLLQVETNIYGTIRIDARAGWINYNMGYASRKSLDILPDNDDLIIPENLQADFKRVASELELYQHTPQDVIAIVKRFFAENFYYSISQNQRYVKGGYLNRFLFDHRQGHCEYFATATALLLREAGIPTRYTIGFSADEYSPWQKSIIVRARHAHSWVQYYLDGEWHLLDTTPANWAPLEAEDRTFLEPIMDIFSWLRYIATSEDTEGSTEADNSLVWLLIPLLLYLGWRFYKKPRVEKESNANKNRDTNNVNGADSPAFALIHKLEQQTDKRKQGETLLNWLRRTVAKDNINDHLEIIQLHYRYRFSLRGDKPFEKQVLATKVKRLLQ